MEGEFKGALANVANQAYASIMADISGVHQSQLEKSANMVIFPPIISNFLSSARFDVFDNRLGF